MSVFDEACWSPLGLRSDMAVLHYITICLFMIISNPAMSIVQVCRLHINAPGLAPHRFVQNLLLDVNVLRLLYTLSNLLSLCSKTTKSDSACIFLSAAFNNSLTVVHPISIEDLLKPQSLDSRGKHI